MLFDKISPEAAGVKSEALARYISLLERRRIPMHSLLMMKGEELFCEYYWKPFDKDFIHRMYSQTKSFVGIAIGLLQDEGKLNINDRIADYFPEKIHSELHPYVARLTIREMLTMSTAGGSKFWFTAGHPDRTELYFNEDKCDCRPSGTVWAYDSAGSQVLSSLVEKLSGKSLLEYLREKLFDKIGTFKTARVLKAPNGDSWGDSAMICTSRDIASFARLLLNGGRWNGEQLISEEYVKEATAKQVDNLAQIQRHSVYHGYGYQIWRTERDGFAFVGMGNQLTIALPNEDVIFVCTSDCQGMGDSARDYIVEHFFELIMDGICANPLPENPEGERKLMEATESLTLFSAKGNEDSPFRQELDGAVYTLEDNPMGITELSFKFKSKDEGELHYVNAQGKKVIPFGINKNVFGRFPQLGYSNEYGGMRTTDSFTYKDAVSAAWLEDKKLFIYVQIIDLYFGTATLRFGFRDDEIVVQMSKVAEDFLNEYQGFALGKRKK